MYCIISSFFPSFDFLKLSPLFPSRSLNPLSKIACSGICPPHGPRSPAWNYFYDASIKSWGSKCARPRNERAYIEEHATVECSSRTGNDNLYISLPNNKTRSLTPLLRSFHAKWKKLSSVQPREFENCLIYSDLQTN